MNEDKGIMNIENTLPEDFDGIFKFTNWSDKDFIGVWDKEEYHFPAKMQSPMHIPKHSALEIQQIRKHFALKLAEREFFNSEQYKSAYLSQERNADGTPKINSIHQAGQYSMRELTPFIQKCLEPLPQGKVRVQKTPVENLEDKLSRNDDGELNTEAIDGKISLRKKAFAA